MAVDRQEWFGTTRLPSDIVIQLEDETFHLHKFPLMSKSRKLHQLITEQETKKRSSKRPRSSAAEAEIELEEEEVVEQDFCNLSLFEFPGGSHTFETVVKFCYGFKIELTSSNVASLRCAGEYLEMTEKYSEDNLISKTERYFTQTVLRDLKETAKTLKSCEGSLMPLAEKLSILDRCIDSIVAKASSTDLSPFGWPVNDEASKAKASNQILWNGIDTGIRRANRTTSAESWFEDLAALSLPIYKRLIAAMKARGLSSKIIESSLISYAEKSITGLSRSNRRTSTTSITLETEQRELLETIITNLPLEKSLPSSGSSKTTKFLFGLLKTANILNASEACRVALERKIALQLEQATLDDLLIPSYSSKIETLYDVDCVERILTYFLERLDKRSEVGRHYDDGESGVGSAEINSLMLLGKLIDGYLSEIALDTNLKLEKFCEVAVALPDEARLFDDGLYRAVDIFLKTHPWMSEEEREKICGVMDCQKLTQEACIHAAQNERLPLRAVVQVLFFEQLQLRHSIAGSLLAGDNAPANSAQPSPLQQALDMAVTTSAPAVIRENHVLRLDMDSMQSRIQKLERECSTMKKAIVKIDKSRQLGLGDAGWRSVTKRFGCKFKTQVCDSHEGTVVECKAEKP